MVAIATFNPPKAPHRGSQISAVPSVDRTRLNLGYDQVRRLAIRPLKVATLIWRSEDDALAEYVESFVDGLIGASGRFFWTPFDKIASPTGILPILTQDAGAALPLRTYFVKFTWYDSLLGETKVSAQSSLVVSANSLIRIQAPPVPSGVIGWRTYISETSGSEKLEATILNGDRRWLQTVALAGSVAFPTTNTLSVPLLWSITDIQRTRNAGLLWDITMNLAEEFV